MVVLPENLFVDLIDIKLADWIKEETMKDSNYVKLNQDEKAEKSIWDSKDVIISKGNIFIDRKQYILDNIALKREIMKKLHNTLPSGHPGELETLNKVSDIHILVARNDAICQKLCQRMCGLSAIQNKKDTN